MAGKDKSATNPDHGEYGRVARQYVIDLRDRYRFRSRWNRRFFRFTGILVTVLSISLPLITVISFPQKDLTIAVIGVAIALSTGLHSFYQWDKNWGLLRRSDFKLTEAYSAWELEMHHAQSLVDGPNKEQRRYDATKALLDKASVIRGKESESYFDALQFPQKPGPTGEKKPDGQ
ncbi:MULTISPECIES: DUF4231 domain-containing protein [unclassified Crossiella]|uniref:DUF4231 domain-containing protein n=1 Tax=unclassified Crossiella TaxID=2620835 RepID=UPI001FFE8767|nr:MULTISPECIES: DUF4231 domain-containing protein [unclassified Crossiella]MCK2242663.1 SLATT domain-containing protein [Crossiella sp. S99.2]MCK2256540.1 SLATT domain-containing protein [Crossiella sp. S99.1]